jgi:predicted RNA-binding protein with PIN domain
MGIHLIVDGYNFLYGSARYGSLGFMGPMEAIEDLIEDLRRYKKAKGFPITVVLDGMRTPGTRVGRHTEKGISIVYSRKGECADDIILRMAKERPQGAVVVTSDRRLSDLCLEAGAAVMSVMEFERRMELVWMGRLKGLQQGDELEEDVPHGSRTKGKKGPSRRPPKGKRRTKKWIDKI